jgi:hypothetical protein
MGKADPWCTHAKPYYHVWGVVKSVNISIEMQHFISVSFALE